MRTLIAATASVLVLAACGGPNTVQETATSVPKRDLTLTTSNASTSQVASRIELATTIPARHRQAPRPAAPVRVEPEPETPVAAPAPVPPPPVPAQPTTAPTVAQAPPSDLTGHELAPGRTVTIIPASTGTSSVEPGTGDWSEVPAPRTGGGVMIGGGRGGRCHGGRGGGPVSILK